MNEIKNTTKLAKAVKQAAASIWIDHLPLSKAYVANYYKNRLLASRKIKPMYRLATGKKLTLKKVIKRGSKSII